MILLILYFILSIFVVVTINRSNDIQNKFVIIFCTICFILIGLRWEYAGDWDNYLRYFTNARELRFDDTSFEYGWVILTYLVKLITDSYVVWQFIIGFIIGYITVKSISKLSVVPILSCLVCFAMMDGGLTYVRSVVANFIVAYSLIFVVEKKLLYFLLTVTIATSIHTSAYVALPLYWFYNLNCNIKKIVYVGLGCVIFFYIAGKTFLSDFSIFGSYVNYKINKYIAAQEAGETYGRMSLESSMINCIIKKSFVFIFIYIYCKEFLESDLKFRRILNVYLCGTIFYLSVVPIALQFARMAGYFDYSECLIYAYIYKYLPDNNKKKLFLLLAIISNAYRIYGHSIVPYQQNYHTIFDYI